MIWRLQWKIFMHKLINMGKPLLWADRDAKAMFYLDFANYDEIMADNSDVKDKK